MGILEIAAVTCILGLSYKNENKQNITFLYIELCPWTFSSLVVKDCDNNRFLKDFFFQFLLCATLIFEWQNKMTYSFFFWEAQKDYIKTVTPWLHWRQNSTIEQRCILTIAHNDKESWCFNLKNYFWYCLWHTVVDPLKRCFCRCFRFLKQKIYKTYLPLDSSCTLFTMVFHSSGGSTHILY